MEPQEMQEKMKNMSPEEIMQLQKQNCIFCHIIAGKVSSKKIHEDDKCIAILDINPANPGHILLLPKEHYMIMPQVPEDIMSHLAIITKQLSSACLKAFKCDGTNVFIANGPAAGQKAQHFMIHIIPRMDNDGVNIMLNENDINKNELKKIYEVIIGRVNEVFGIKGQEAPKKDTVNQEIEELEKETEKTKELIDNLSGKKDAMAETKKMNKNSLDKSKKRSNKEIPKKKKEIDLDDITKLFG